MPLDEEHRKKIAAGVSDYHKKRDAITKDDVCAWLWENYFKLGRGTEWNQVFKEWKVHNVKA